MISRFKNITRIQNTFLRLTPIAVQKMPYVIRHFSGRMMPDFDPNVDYYKQLGVSKDASEQEIKKAYYKLAQ